MRVLALDTTNRSGSTALVADGRVVDERSGDPTRTHAERLPGELLSLLAANGWAVSSIDLFAVASGPGSFTGLRIGIATIQGMAFVGRRPVIGLSALAALGQVGSINARPGDRVGAWIDAHRHDVFSALYTVSDAELFDPRRLIEIEAPAVEGPSVTLQRWDARLNGSPTTLLGDGAVVYADAVERTHAAAYRLIRETPRLAGAIGCMATILARSGIPSSAAGVQPLYVRRPDAEIDRERRASAPKSDGGRRA